ncbi:hypothetical protein F4811DRAFT_250097 [Daldinia bambusicola]|nr:hypothetical protein F4811DRAFT_250097 [Daldinia bambusicola]
MVNLLPDRIHSLDMTDFDPEEKAAIAELRAARELKSLKDAEAARETEEEENFAHAKLTGEVLECGCCFDEYALNRMVHCDGHDIHWFCRNCMKLQAETNVGLSKYEISCMSVDGCEAGFSADQKKLFLDKKLRVALERLEQEAMLRMAGIENLETCPFCPYAAECPPIEVDKEFTCVNPGCEKVSCRLCHKETHIPKTCAEASRDHGLDARHVLEEAMSEALIRNCNNCKTPYLKVNGCNKVYCTKCSTMQCYVCRQTITGYAHFDDARRGGKSGQCPLFDKTEERHEQEVQQAEEKARLKMLQDNADITEEVLQINLSDQVREDDQKRKKENIPPQPQLHLDPAVYANHMDIINRAREQARQPRQPVANNHPIPRDVPPHPYPPVYPRVHPLPQPLGGAGGPQARGMGLGAVVPLIPAPNDQRQQQAYERLQQQRDRLQQLQRIQMDIVRGRHFPRGVAPDAPMHPPQVQQEAMQHQPGNLLNLAVGRQHGPQVLQQGAPNNLPQNGPVERVDPLYQPVDRRNGFLHLHNPYGFNFQRR